MRRSISRLRLISFGLDDAYIQNVYEELFLMKYHGGWSFLEAYNLPIIIRRWFLQRLIKQKQQEKEEMDKSSKAKK